jgi:hypothetical protein
MPIKWFDDPKNNSASLNSRIAIDCQAVNSLTSNLIGMLAQNAGALIVGLFISFYH